MFRQSYLRWHFKYINCHTNNEPYNIIYKPCSTTKKQFLHFSSQAGFTLKSGYELPINRVLDFAMLYTECQNE